MTCSLITLFVATTAAIVPSSYVSNSSAVITESERANSFFEEYYDEMLRRSPMSQTALGLKWDYDKLDDLSVDFADETVEIVRQRVEELASRIDYLLLDEQARLSYDLFVLDAERIVEGHRFRDHHYPLDQMYGRQSTLPAFLINTHRIDSVEDAEAYIARLRAFPAFFEQVLEQTVRQKAQGISPPRFVFDYVLSDSRNIISGAPFEDSGDESALYEDFRVKIERLDLPGDERERLLGEAAGALVENVLPTYEGLIEHVEGLQAEATTDDGVWKLPDGDTFYAYRLRTITTTNLSADEIHEIGLANVDRIHDEMHAIMDQVGFEGTLAEFFEFMREDPQFFYENTEEGRQRYLAEAVEIIENMKERLPELFLQLPQADLEVRAVEPFREASAGKAFYQRPAPDGSRPGVYYANLYRMEDMPTYQMEALAYHEGVPGHHTQISLAQELEGLPRFRRYGGYTAYTEGWGLYSELVPKEIGLYADPYSDFGRLAMELWRASRLVVDTGIHAKRWTREQAIEYLVDNTPNPPGDARKAIERYIVMPGQATAYMLGMLKILDLRDEARSALGSRFDLRSFHDVVLRNGPVPLSVLEDLVRDWIASLEAIGHGDQGADD